MSAFWPYPTFSALIYNCHTLLYLTMPCALTLPNHSCHTCLIRTYLLFHGTALCFIEQTCMSTLSRCVRITSLTSATASFLKIQMKRAVGSCVWIGWCIRSATQAPVPALTVATTRGSRSISGHRGSKSFSPSTGDTVFGQANPYTQVE